MQNRTGNCRGAKVELEMFKNIPPQRQNIHPKRQQEQGFFAISREITHFESHL